MIEFDSETLRMDRGSSIHVKLENGWLIVTWRRDPENKNESFRFPFTFICRILNEFFKDNEWYPLGADTNKHPSIGFGGYLVETQKHLKYFSPSPQYASALAGIMVTLDLIEYREEIKQGRPISLKKK
jgi:hypothetical protein